MAEQLYLMSFVEAPSERESGAHARRVMSLDERFIEFANRNPRVLERALEIAVEWMIRGDRYISVKAIYEVMRTERLAINGESEAYRLNNSYTAPLSRWLQHKDPRLSGIIRTRERRGNDTRHAPRRRR